MGKKMKKKATNPRKAQNRISTESPKSVLEGSGGDGDGDMKACNHYTKSTYELNQILVKIRSSSMDFVACEHCREEPVNKRGGKEKGKQPKKKGTGTRASEAKSEQNFLWVCLDCGGYFCGGGVSILEPYGHARRHSKQDHHQWAVRAEDPLISWCYSCSSSVLIVMPDEVIKEGNESDKSRSLRDIAFEPMDSEKLKGYKVRGLLNLGNTCFFNSVMQNLFAMDLLRGTLLGLDMPVGPLSVALRMLFTETSRGADSKGVINPKALFGCICAKAPQFRGYQQQDSHELLRYLLDGLHVEETNARKTSEVADDEEKINIKTKATLVDAIFSGQLSSTISCMECRHTSVVNEPFLDLSLPVPSKKHPSKKVPPPPPKRVNQRDKKKSRQPRESVTQVSTMSVNQNAESNEQTSECIESITAVPPPTHDKASEAQDFTWMDYLAGESPNCNYFSAHELEASIESGSYSKQEEAVSNEQSVSEFHDETESIVQSLSDLQTASCSTDLTVSLDTFVRGSCKDEVPHSCAPDTGIIFLPNKEQNQDLVDLDINDRTSCSQDPDNINPIDVSVSESCAANSSCKQAEEEFDGFGDLFNEPEDTSHLNAERNAGEDMDINSWIGNISESNMEEVDDTDVPVSINSCLALFTKPELLSDEHAWYCERCSENSQGNRELGTSKLQAADVSDMSVTLKSLADKDELISKKVVSNFVRYSANVNGLDTGKLVSSPKNEAVLVEERFDQCEEISNSQKQINLDGSQNSGEISSTNTLHLTETTPFPNMACCPDVLDKDMSVSGSETSQYLPTSSICVISPQYSLSNPESNLHGINDRSNVENDGKKPKVASHSLQSQSNILLHKSSIDRSQEVSRVRKKGLKSGKIHPAKEKGERINMIKRDALKRILIDRVPPILTIHLKRFSQDSRGRLTKLGGHVNFQETLDLRPYMDPRCINDRTSYRLIGVVEHSGSINGGHYVAYVRGDGRGSRNSNGQAWFYASDAYVREVSLAVVLNSEAYILFYERM